jgi:hypothetical protein
MMQTLIDHSLINKNKDTTNLSSATSIRLIEIYITVNHILLKIRLLNINLIKITVNVV